MSYTQYGDQNYRFGFTNASDAEAIATATGLSPESLRVSGSPLFTAEGEDSEADVVAFVKGAEKFEFTMEGKIVNKTLFDAADDFSYDGKFYIITNREVTTSNKEFEKGSFTGMHYPSITSAP